VAGMPTCKENDERVNKYPTKCNYTQFVLSVNCSTCFGWFLHPSSGAQITIFTASGTGQLEKSLRSSTIATVSSNG